MVHTFVRHKVKDYPSWKRGFDAFVENRAAAGERKWWISHVAGDPNNLVLWFEWDNAENARKFLESDQLKEAMKRAGVLEEPEIYILEEVARGETRSASVKR